ncbi:MAG: hypothetical protein A3J29_06565 [Acidobacteria bacterium RIFCSPLOWO2_12_FULL_67_14b]|nr:MAG: hypothetical protein A3J29_06565 [Acidobacteria bacterium RIFCSPLOWO2_12_FULL_67_14b]
MALAVIGSAATTLAQDVPQPPDPPPAPDGFLPEPHFITRAIDFATRTMGDGSGEKSGFYAEMGHMITGAGWISAGAGYRQWIGGDRLVLDASAAMSWRSYKMARARFEFTNLARSRVALGAEGRWQDFTQNSHFGDGAASLEADRSEYRVKSLNVIGYTNVRPMKWLTIGGRAGWLQRPELLVPAGTFQRNYPAMQETFADDPAFALAKQPNYAHGEASITADTRDRRSHPLEGGLYRGSWTRFSDRDNGRFSFQRFEAEGAHFVPVAGSAITLALRGWLVASDTAEGALVPFYLMPSLGGNNTLRAYANYRFHDRHLAVVNVESRFALLRHLDAVLFADAGNVAARMADLNLDKTSFGFGLRMHSTQATFARLDVAHGAEGWRVVFNTSDPLHLSRLSRRTAPIPFVP